MAKARDIPGLAPELSFRDAASLAVGTRAAEVWEHEHGVLDTGKIEGVHDMRVATRRLRAVMEIFAPCFPKKRHREALREVKGLADVLGRAKGSGRDDRPAAGCRPASSRRRIGRESRA